MPPGQEQALLLEMARDAGSLLLRYFRQDMKIEAKGALDVVTEADFASESIIRSRISQHFPGDAITAEESGSAGNSSRHWFIDPLDGTVNFSNGIASFAVCIAFYDGQEGQCAAVFNPFTRECFTAARGRGAFLNGLPIHCGEKSQPKDAQVWVNAHGLRFPDHAEQLLDIYRRLGRNVMGIVNPGSMAMALCSIAAGRLDAGAALDMDHFSTPAAALIMAEAGVKVTDLEGAPYTPASPTLLAANPQLHTALSAVLGSV